MVDRSDTNDRLVRASQLVSTTEIAAAFDRASENIANLSRRNDTFPRPVAILGTDKRPLRLWVRNEVLEWGRRNGYLEIDAEIPRLTADAQRDEMLSATEVAQLLRWSSSGSLPDRVRRGTFPPPDMMIGTHRGWWKSTVLEWQAAKDAKRSK